MTEINGKVAKVRYLNPFSYEIDLDTSKFSAYTREGISSQVKVPSDFHFKKFADSLAYGYGHLKREFDNPSLEKFDRPEQLHLAINAVLEFVE